MFNSILNNSTADLNIIICILATLVMGFVFSAVYCYLKRTEGFYKDVAITYVVMPVVVCGLSLILTYAMTLFDETTDVTRYGRVLIALLSVFVMIRFRSEQRTLEELTFVFFLTAIGLCNGLGYLAFSGVLYVVVLVVMVVLHMVGFPFEDKRCLIVKITIPEDLNYENVFNEVMTKFTTKWVLRKVKTKDMGTMFLLTYYVQMKKGTSMKEFSDRLRELNGNLDIAITVASNENRE